MSDETKVINTEEQLEWWNTFDGILSKFSEVVEENKSLKRELEELKTKPNAKKRVSRRHNGTKES